MNGFHESGFYGLLQQRSIIILYVSMSPRILTRVNQIWYCDFLLQCYSVFFFNLIDASPFPLNTTIEHDLEVHASPTQNEILFRS
jgi:hypothetical protein